MGKLLPFEKRRRPPRAQSDTADAGQVIMFTGIRYQRGTPVQPTDGSKPQRPSRKRV